VQRVLSADDESIQAHIHAVQDGVAFIRANPLGAGIGSSVDRYGAATVPGESALLAIGGEMGVLGLLLFGGLYGALVLVGLREIWRHRRDPCAAALAAIVGVGGLVLTAIVLTSQVWGDFSVTFLFWWAAGSLVLEVSRLRPRDA
jgi:O-antigen ligase